MKWRAFRVLRCTICVTEISLAYQLMSVWGIPPLDRNIRTAGCSRTRWIGGWCSRSRGSLRLPPGNGSLWLNCIEKQGLGLRFNLRCTGGLLPRHLCRLLHDLTYLTSIARFCSPSWPATYSLRSLGRTKRPALVAHDDMGNMLAIMRTNYIC